MPNKDTFELYDVKTKPFDLCVKDLPMRFGSWDRERSFIAEKMQTASFLLKREILKCA